MRGRERGAATRSTHRWTLGLVCLAVLALPMGAGCDAIARLSMSPAERAASDLREALAPRQTASRAAFAAIDLPGGVATDAAPTSLRVLIGEDAISVDALPPFEARFAAIGDAYALDRTPAAIVPPPIARVATLAAGQLAEADLRGGAHSLIVEPLFTHLGALADTERAAALAEERPRDTHVAIAVARRVPYGTVASVLYTAANVGYDEAAFLVRDGGIVVSIPRAGDRVAVSERAQAEATAAAVAAALEGLLEGDVIADGTPTDDAVDDAVDDAPAAPSDAPSPSDGEPLVVTFEIGPRGVTVHGPGGTLAPGCGHMGDAADVTVPRVGGALDAGALGACAQAIAPQVGEEGLVVLGATRDTPFEEVATSFFALRGAPGRPVLPRVGLAAPLP